MRRKDQELLDSIQSYMEDKDGFIKTVLGNISEVLNSRLSETACEADKGRYAALQKDLQVLLTSSLKSPTAESAREYERLVKELEELKFKIERDEKDREMTKMSMVRVQELEAFIAESRVFEKFDAMVFRKLVERVVINEDSVTFKFTDYLERTVPLVD